MSSKLNDARNSQMKNNRIIFFKVFINVFYELWENLFSHLELYFRPIQVFFKVK